MSVILKVFLDTKISMTLEIYIHSICKFKVELGNKLNHAFINIMKNVGVIQVPKKYEYV